MGGLAPVHAPSRLARAAFVYPWNFCYLFFIPQIGHFCLFCSGIGQRSLHAVSVNGGVDAIGPVSS